MISCRILIPCEAPCGVAEVAAALRYAEAFMLSTAGGFTRHGVVDGHWRAPNGDVVREQVFHYECAVDWNSMSHPMRHLARELATRLQQECIYLAIGDSVELVGPNA